MASDGTEQRAGQPEEHRGSAPAVPDVAGVDAGADAADGLVPAVGVSPDEHPPVRLLELPVLHGTGPRLGDGGRRAVDGVGRGFDRAEHARRHHRRHAELHQGGRAADQAPHALVVLQRTDQPLDTDADAGVQPDRRHRLEPAAVDARLQQQQQQQLHYGNLIQLTEFNSVEFSFHYISDPHR